MGVGLAVFATGAAHGQLSLTGAVTLAMQNSPHVMAAQAEVAKARAVLAETHNVYIPALAAGAGIGDSFGYTPNPPTLFNLNAGSVVFNKAQSSYIRAAREGLNAAKLNLQEAQDATAEDVISTAAALDHDTLRVQALRQQNGFASRLVTIVQDRLAAGQSTAVDLTQAQLTAANLRLAALRTEDDAAYEQEHLERLTGLAKGSLRLRGGFPETALLGEDVAAAPTGMTAAVESAFAGARSKQQTARGDSRYLFWPQINLAAQYNRYASFTESLRYISTAATPIPLNEEVFGFQITIPFFDKLHAARARESLAEAMRSQHEAENARDLALDAQSKLFHSLAELRERREVARLELQLAQQQLQITTVQMESASSTGTLTSPMDEQNARISEREKYLAMLDATYQLRTSEISLLRQTGRLQAWLQQAAAESAPAEQTPAKPGLPSLPEPAHP